MRLYYYPHAPYSRKVLLAAHEKEVTVERELCPPFDAPAKARLKAFHPLATVPLLVDGKDVLTESSIIVEAFDLASDRGPSLLPRDPRAALRVRALDRFSDARLMAPTAYLAWALKKAEDTRNTEKIRAEQATLDTALTLLDAAVGDRAFVAGDELSMADLSPASAISCILADRTLEDLARWPNVARWYEGMVARPSFQAIIEECRNVPLPSGF